MSYGFSPKKSFLAVCVMALALLSPMTGWAGQWSAGFSGFNGQNANNRNAWRQDNRGDNGWRDNDWNRGRNDNRWNRPHDHGAFSSPVYFNDYRPRVVTRYVYQEPVIVYQRPPVVYQRDVVYYRNVPAYRIGDRLPEFYNVPTNIVAQLGPPPSGYYYSMGPRNVYVVSHYDNAIAQIIDLLLQ